MLSSKQITEAKMNLKRKKCDDIALKCFLNEDADSYYFNTFTNVDVEILKRFEILRYLGLNSDIDIEDVYLNEKKICCSTKFELFGTIGGTVNRMSETPRIKELTETVPDCMDKIDYLKHYFVMSSVSNTSLSFLRLSMDENNWEIERKLLLKKQMTIATVFDLLTYKSETRWVYFSIEHGTPLVINY